MNHLLAYFLGLITIPVLLALWVALSWAVEQFRRTDLGWKCGSCDQAWGFLGDGSVVAVARARSQWHFTFAHPGIRGRHLVLLWRGWVLPSDRRRFRRLAAAYPAPPVTLWDVVARLPLISSIAYSVARRHGTAKRGRSGQA